MSDNPNSDRILPMVQSHAKMQEIVREEIDIVNHVIPSVWVQSSTLIEKLNDSEKNELSLLNQSDTKKVRNFQLRADPSLTKVEDEASLSVWNDLSYY